MRLTNISLGERLVVPAVLLLIFATLSGTFMVGVGGTTKRLKIILRFTLIFMGGLLYSMAYHDKIGDLFGWDDGWIGVTVGVAIVCVYLCRRALAKRLTDPTSER